MKNKNYPLKIDKLTNKTNTNKTNINKSNIYNKKNRNMVNRYKTFSEISSKQNDTQKMDTSINTIHINNNNIFNNHYNLSNYNNTYCNNSNNFNNYLIIKEVFSAYKDNKDNKNIYHKENGIFNGEVLYFDENGLKYGLRGKKDGYEFFGTDTHFHGKIINDYVLNINYRKRKRSFNSSSCTSNSLNEEKNNNIPIVYFVIYYEKDINKFFLKNIRKINYNNLESFIFSFAIYKRYITNSLKIIENIIICFHENQNYALCFLLFNNNSLKVYLIKIDDIEKGNNHYNKSCILYKTIIENNGVSKIIGNKGNIKIDLKGNSYLLYFNKSDKCWEIKTNSKKNEIFWIIVDKKSVLNDVNKENIFKINSQFFKIIYN